MSDDLEDQLIAEPNTRPVPEIGIRRAEMTPRPQVVKAMILNMNANTLKGLSLCTRAAHQQATSEILRSLTKAPFTSAESAFIFAMLGAK